MIKLFSLYILSLKVAVSKNLSAVLSEDSLYSRSREACTGIFKKSEMLRCWGSSTGPGPHSQNYPHARSSELSLKWFLITASHTLTSQRGNAPELLFCGKFPSPECSGPQQCCLFGYCHGCTSLWSFLPGIYMHIKHLPVMATGLTSVTACP